jgi:alpha-L-fucosidase
VREFTDAMHAAGMRVALFLSPHDDHFPSSSADYETYFLNQLTELLTNYGPVSEIEFNGYQAPTSLDWTGIVQLAHRLQPGVLVYLGPEIAAAGADLRYLGDQTAQASRSTSSVGNVPNGGPSNTWYPAEGPVSDRGLNTWFWHPNDSVISLANLQSIYFTSVGMNATPVVNVPPATTGQLDAPDLDLLRQFGSWYRALYATDLTERQPIAADSTWASPGFEAAKAVDGDLCTYWAAAAGQTAGRLEITPPGAVTFSVISLREPIELGERVTSYHLEIKQNGRWNKSPTDTGGAIVAGTLIGQRQLWRLPPTTADAIAIVIDTAKDVPAIAEVGVY